MTRCEGYISKHFKKNAFGLHFLFVGKVSKQNNKNQSITRDCVGEIKFGESN